MEDWRPLVDVAIYAASSLVAGRSLWKLVRQLKRESHVIRGELQKIVSRLNRIELHLGIPRYAPDQQAPPPPNPPTSRGIVDEDH
jgi:hypothetical protein